MLTTDDIIRKITELGEITPQWARILKRRYKKKPFDMPEVELKGESYDMHLSVLRNRAANPGTMYEFDDEMVALINSSPRIFFCGYANNSVTIYSEDEIVTVYRVEDEFKYFLDQNRWGIIT